MSLFRIATEIVVRRSYLEPPQGIPEEDDFYLSYPETKDIDGINRTELDGDYRISAPRHNFGGQILWALGEEHR